MSPRTISGVFYFIPGTGIIVSTTLLYVRIFKRIFIISIFFAYLNVLLKCVYIICFRVRVRSPNHKPNPKEVNDSIALAKYN